MTYKHKITHKVSIVIPFHNNEKTIEDCLWAVIKQTYNNLEIIVINDGSNDRSGVICSKVAQDDTRIKIFNQSNKGVSAARNKGIEESTGDFILFIDADDLVANDIVEHLVYCIIKHNANIALCNYAYIDNPQCLPESVSTYINVLDGNAALDDMLYQKTIESGCVAKLYGTAILKNERFNEKLTYAEDLEFNCRIFNNSLKIVHSTAKKYYYVRNISSATMSNYKLSRYSSLLELIELFGKSEYIARHKQAISRRIFFDTLDNILRIRKGDISQYNLQYKYCKIIIRKYLTSVVFDSHIQFYSRLRALVGLINLEVMFILFEIKGRFISNLRVRTKNVIKNENIVILTQPLGTNYGGILQAYALQRTLTSLGYAACTNMQAKPIRSIKTVLRSMKRCMMVILKKAAYFNIYSTKARNILSENTLLFINKNINTVDLKNGREKININSAKNFNAFIVGSDQAWRKAYSNIPEHLLNFTEGMDVKRISYAASFGKDDLSEYGPKLIKKSAKLAKKFDAISVREDTGADICKKYWGVDAVQVVDPTLLLEKSDYNKLIKDDTKLLKLCSGKIFTYILDRDSTKQSIIDHISKARKQKVFDIMPPKPMSSKELKSNPEKYMLPHVTQWLKSFADADFVVTDSFHGCVFSIIYNKPFIAIGNKNRGLTRFTSLLKVFHLENRLVTSINDVECIVQTEIDWKKVNEIKAYEKQRAIAFLQTSLNVNKNAVSQK